MKPIALVLFAASTLALAGCDSAPEQPAEPTATPEVSAPATEAPAVETPAVDAPAAETPAMSVEIPADTMVPGTNMTAEEAMDAVQQDVDAMNLTDAQKLEAVAEARKQAEDAARNAGLSDEQITQAGDAAEQAAKTMFGVQ